MKDYRVTLKEERKEESEPVLIILDFIRICLASFSFGLKNYNDGNYQILSIIHHFRLILKKTLTAYNSQTYFHKVW